MKPLALVLTLAFAASLAPAAENTLTPEERKAGWELLFDGRSWNGWRAYRKPASEPIKGWEVVDGMLHCLPNAKGDQPITARKFRDYELSWDWKLLVAEFADRKSTRLNSSHSLPSRMPSSA